jgi:hypothetical protein
MKEMQVLGCERPQTKTVHFWLVSS